MKYVYLVLNWTFGALLLLTGLVALVDTPIPGLLLISISALLLPPVRSWVHSKTGKEITTKARVVSIFALFIILSVFVGQSEQRKVEQIAAQEAKQRAEQAEVDRQKTIDYFNTNSSQILADIKAALNNREFQKAVTLSSKYIAANNPDLSELNVAAKEKLAEVQKADKTAKLLAELKNVAAKEKLVEAQRADKTATLLAELKNVPVGDAERNKALYQQLVDLHPDNQGYRSKLKLCTDKIADEQEKKRLAEDREQKIKTLFSGWDGSHRGLVRVIKDSMNDPKSYEHVETVYWDRGDHLVVMTTFRGKNAFGGIVKNSIKAKISLDGQVLKIID